MSYNNDEFIDCLMDCCGDTFSDFLDLKDSSGKNCLHYLFTWSKDLSPEETTIRRVQKLAPKAKAETLATPNMEGDTPIHLAVKYSRCRGKPEHYMQVIKNMILQGDEIMKTTNALNAFGESPLLYCQRTREEYRTQLIAKAEKRLNERAQKESTLPQTMKRQPSITKGREPCKPTGIGRSIATEETEFSFKESQNRIQKPLENPPGPYPARRASTFVAGVLTPSAIDIHLPISKGQHILPSNSIPPPPSPSIKKGSELNGGKGGSGVRSTESAAKAIADKKLASEDKPALEIIKFLTMHYIRTRSDMEARALIFKKNTSGTFEFPLPELLNQLLTACQGIDKNLYFDATGHQRVNKIVDLVDRMKSGGFCDTLSYVYIPTVQHTEGNQSVLESGKKSYSSATGNRGLQENSRLGRDALVNVFQKLHEAGVRSILRLCVEDREHPSHTDAAIEKALQGRDSTTDGLSGRESIYVEDWDWRKPDLSTDVIAFAAPTVEIVNLYWSGNQTVLRAWACREGIPRLYAATEGRLRTVIIHAAPGLESRARMDKMLERFKNEVARNTDAEINIEINRRMSGLLPQQDVKGGSTGTTGGQAAEHQHAWIEKMEEFRGALMRVSRLRDIKPEHRVKLALIDDGVDICDLDTYNNLVAAAGLSYCPREGRSERPWHRSNNGHGTVMANMIVRVNPWVSLYVMRIHEGASRDGSRVIYADSAARAIQGAIDLQVDIISISWTIKNMIETGTQTTEDSKIKQTAEARAIANLGTAVAKAISDDKILMFCSTSDDIRLGAMDTLPYQKGRNIIFRIGAALSLGQRDHQSEAEDMVDFYLPGNRVASSISPQSTNKVEYHDGSSVSTALAAGLASLIMHCAHIAEQHIEGKKLGGRNQFQGLREALRKRENMETAFTNIVAPDWKKKKYLPVWKMFGEAAVSIDKEKGDDNKLDRLVDLIADLCHRVPR